MMRTLAPSDPTMAPTVFAAYTPPTRRAGSWPGSAMEASARGKLAPHRIAPGSTAHSDRTRSSWKLNHGSVEIDGLIGQYGNDCVSMYAVQATAPHRAIWQTPSATRGRPTPRASAEPRLLPMPRPIKNTARIRENVYTVAPKSSERRRVHTTSAASAVIPDSAIVT